MTAFYDPDVAVAPRVSLNHERNFQIAFVVFSGLTVLAGTIAIIGAGGVASLWLRNPVMWCVTVALCAGVRRLSTPPPWVMAIMIVALALSILVGPNQAGVHRWLAVGSVQLNVAALVMPTAILLANRGIRVDGQPGFALATLGMAATLAWQPDNPS